MHKLTKAEIMREVKDYIYITLGLISYSLGWAAFLLPYQITTGGTTGIGAIIYYASHPSLLRFFIFFYFLLLLSPFPCYTVSVSNCCEEREILYVDC